MSAILKIKKLVSSDGFQKYFINTFWLLGEKIGTMGVSFIIGAIVARHLGPGGLGILSYAQSIIIFAGILSTAGIETLLPRDLVEQPENENKVLGTAFFLRVIGSLFSLVLLGVGLFFMQEDSETNLIIGILSLGILFQSFNVIDCFYQSKVLSKFVVRVKFFQFGISTIIKLILIWISAPVLWFAVQLLIHDIVLGIGLGLIFNWKHGNMFKWRLDKKYALKLLGDSWPLLIGGFVIVIYMKVDQIMIKHLLSTEATGIYSIAVKLSEIFYFIPGIVCASLFPAIINAKNNDPALYKARMQQLVDLMIVLAFGLSISMTFISGFVIPFIYGPEYSAASMVLSIHIWASLFVFMGFAGSKWIIAENLQKYILYSTTVGAIVNVLLNFTIIPLWGINGAAIATFASQVVASYLMYLVFPKTRYLFWIKTRSLTLYSVFLRIKEKLKK